MLKDWSVYFYGPNRELQSVFSLSLSSNGQVGVFPEQQENWNWIHSSLTAYIASEREKEIKKDIETQKERRSIRILNGFAYTGGASMWAARVPGVSQITHCDAAKSSVLWARRNMDMLNNTVLLNSHEKKRNDIDQDDPSQRERERDREREKEKEKESVRERERERENVLAPIRWITDDCLTFLKREIRREEKYEGLIFDPPAFGRGGGRKMWQIERDYPLLISLLPELLSEKPAFIVLSCHDRNWSKERLSSLLRESMKQYIGEIECGEMGLES
eukprot:CAMPEP_0182419734 /NCGR_PEP_ID=MMETSP1167-20130531/4119_1 /TAXON_ID=2988 /ORGANISM="Mallomonas Sp, Strain CCMP3275" /LENGTH=274 /DNA_ID=CAMNT_0024594805 /DNA_START=415 /DNA_END=1236 /DNA_ORIENTATION=+